MKATAIQKAIGIYGLSHPAEAHEAKQEMSVILNRVHKLEAFVEKFLDNFNTCQDCGGTGKDEQTGECLTCVGTAVLIASYGVLKVELYSEAEDLLKAGEPTGKKS